MTKFSHCEIENLHKAATILISEIDASGDINAIVAASNPLRRVLYARCACNRFSREERSVILLNRVWV